MVMPNIVCVLYTVNVSFNIFIDSNCIILNCSSLPHSDKVQDIPYDITNKYDDY